MLTRCDLQRANCDRRFVYAARLPKHDGQQLRRWCCSLPLLARPAQADQAREALQALQQGQQQAHPAAPATAQAAALTLLSRASAALSRSDAAAQQGNARQLAVEAK